MSTITYIILFTLLGSIVSLIGGIGLLTHKRFALKISHFLGSFAAGALLGAAFFDLLPEAVEEAHHVAQELGIEEVNVFFWTLLGILLFFLLERFLHWFHHHHQHDDHNHAHGVLTKKPTVALIIIGDTLHNFIDGVAIAATFMVSIPLGIVTTLAVAAHEIPQEVGDFGILLNRGMSRVKILLVNIVSAGFSLLGALLMVGLGERLEGILPIALALTAGFFIYIAASDLIPEIHEENRKGFAVIETGLLIAGIAVVWIAISVVGSLLGAQH